MFNFRGAQFIKSASKRDERPEKDLPEIVFIGKSNVGKSSLINALTDNRSLCFTSSKPGHTRLLNYFEILDKCYLVDAPGYGYSKAGGANAELFAHMMEEYLHENKWLKGLIFLLDSRHPLSPDDADFLAYVHEEQIPFFIVLTKCDKLNQKEKVQMHRRLVELIGDDQTLKIFFTSSTTKIGLDALRSQIAQII